MSEPFVWFDTRELRRRRLQMMARFGFYLLTATAAVVVFIALDPF